MNKLKEKRIAKGLTQAQLAELAGLSRQMISHIEIGKNTINVHHARDLAQVLECEIEDFFI